MAPRHDFYSVGLEELKNSEMGVRGNDQKDVK